MAWSCSLQLVRYLSTKANNRILESALDTCRTIQHSWKIVQHHVNIEEELSQLAVFRKQGEDPGLWEDPPKAKYITMEQERIQKLVNIHEKMEEMEMMHVLLEEAAEHRDHTSVQFFANELEELKENVKEMEWMVSMNGEADKGSCFIDVHAGAGGTESMDWASMLLNMYKGWGAKRGFQVEQKDEQLGEVAGMKRGTLHVDGLFAYGFAKWESGIHRLIRVSPFDGQQRRHTSFASVYVHPVPPPSTSITIHASDLRVETMRASGAGGQHVNTTDSAVRIVHVPSGITVRCQNQRSQHQNRASAMSMLEARLYALELEEKERLQKKQGQERPIASFGSQIRSYVLHPYHSVKDHRCGVSTTKVDQVLSGDIDRFIYGCMANPL